MIKNKEEKKKLEDNIIDHLKKVGQEIDESWTEIDLEDYSKSLEFKTDKEHKFMTSVLDRPDPAGDGMFLVRYRYSGPVDAKNRDFCARVMSLGRVYSYEDINFTLSNPEFGSYNIFDYKGSYGCRHTWQRVYFYQDFGDNEQRRVGSNTISRAAAGLLDDKATTKNAFLSKWNIPFSKYNMSDMDKEIYSLKIDKDKAKLDENIGINEIAFTSNPAIEVKGFYFNKQRKLMFKDEHKMRVVSPALIPDIEIFRKDEDGEYYVKFTKEDIEILVENFMSKGGVNKFNDEHSDIKPKSYILESWIIETENDKAYEKYNFKKDEVPLGSFMVISQITDKEYFQNEVIENSKTGFSVEGFFDQVLELNKNKKEDMSKVQKFELDGKFYTANEEGKLVLLESDEKKEEKEDMAEKEEDVKAEKEDKEMESNEKKDEDLEKKEDENELESDDKEDDKEDDKLEEDESEEKEEKEEVYTKSEVDAKIEGIIDMIAKIEANMESKDEEEDKDELSKFSKKGEDNIIDGRVTRVMNLSKLFN